MKKFFLPALFVAIISTLGVISAEAQLDTGLKVISSKEFILSEEVAAAGIDGKLKVQITVDKAGAVKNPKILGGVIWPCDTNPKDQLAAVENAVKANLLEAKFSPAMKDGKPQETDLFLSFLIGNTYREAVEERAAEAAAAAGKTIPRIVEAGVITGRALRLPRPRYPAGAKMGYVSGAVQVGILIGEDGNVISAGVVSGHPSLRPGAREAACDSKFAPTALKGRPVKVSGIVTYNFYAP